MALAESVGCVLNRNYKTRISVKYLRLKLSVPNRFDNNFFSVRDFRVKIVRDLLKHFIATHIWEPLAYCTGRYTHTRVFPAVSN